jgi:hypothetical protein
MNREEKLKKVKDYIETARFIVALPIYLLAALMTHLANFISGTEFDLL